MHKVKFLFKMHCVLLFSTLMFAENIESAFNFNLDDTKTLIDVKINFNHLNTNNITQENSIYLYIDSQLNSNDIIWDNSLLQSMKKSNKIQEV